MLFFSLATKTFLTEEVALIHISHYLEQASHLLASHVS